MSLVFVDFYYGEKACLLKFEELVLTTNVILTLVNFVNIIFHFLLKFSQCLNLASVKTPLVFKEELILLNFKKPGHTLYDVQNVVFCTKKLLKVCSVCVQYSWLSKLAIFLPAKKLKPNLKVSIPFKISSLPGKKYRMVS